MALTSSQRQQLKSSAHHLEPAVLIGKHGVTDTLVRSVFESLEAHELIKIKFIDRKDEKRELTPEIVRRTDAEVVDVIGHVVILYRQHPEPEKRKIALVGD